MRFKKSTLSPHLEGILCSNGSLVAENGDNNCQFSLLIGTIARLFCNHNETEMSVNTTSKTQLLLLSRKFWILVAREGQRFEKILPRGQIREFWAFSETIDNQQLLFSLHFMNLSKLCNEVVKCMEWACHSYALRGSKLSSERVKAYLWAT